MNKLLQGIKNNTTFVVSGHNIKWFGVMAVESLIDNCNIKREQVVYFDDFSTDGTAKEMHARGIKTITWDEEIYDFFINSELREDLPVRVSQIIASAIKQNKRKYLCVLDGDLFHLKDTVSGIIAYIKEKLPANNSDFLAFGAKRIACNFPYLKDMGYNLYQGIMYLNTEEMINEKIVGENINELISLYQKYGSEVFNKYYDTGNCLYYNLQNKKLPLITVDFMSEEFLDMQGFHVGTLSSQMRKDENYSGDMQGDKNRAVWFMEHPLTVTLCEKYNININTVKNDYEKLLRKSPTY